ncbi:hypothetical protein [Methanothrix soehngenii]|uniref:hypothetical protein n=1 Tax=Methanothrix soehngenii TaxID=2223 RepID=UPI00300C1C5C
MSNFTSRTISTVRSNCSSVSPQKPTMMSVWMATSGTMARMRAISARYSALV